MKRTAIYLLIVFAFAGTTLVFSQNNGNGKAGKGGSFVEVHIDKLKRDIMLTADQEKEIRKLLERLYKDREKAQKKDNPNSEKIIEKKTSQQTYETQRDNILTEEQKNRLLEKSEQRKANVQDRINR